ncbi:hypothetical protein MSHO_61690 [Mycobacterium shottsii]|uniref:ABC transporter ATP-binding protein n=1 Tax=Mycobacterium shottsii TaxID=133549 RepID=A0A7I7LLX9_9MYCO|nr:hypothetical protein MSHO_61690 [Mycobacterium shottsii]
MRLFAMQVPGQLLFSIASQLALIVLAGATAALTVGGTLTVPAIALIVVIARYLEPFTAVSELAPALQSVRAMLDRIRSVLTAPAVAAGTATLHDGPAAARIEFDHVAFSYDGATEPVLGGSVSACSRVPRLRSWALGIGKEHDPGADCGSAPADRRPHPD